MSNAELQALLAYWVRILRLQDWTITATFKRHHAMDGYMGLSTSLPKLMIGRVEILDPVDHNPAGVEDVEQTLVHELLHVRFGYIHDKWAGAETVLYEQAIEQMSWTMVRLNRGER